MVETAAMTQRRAAQAEAEAERGAAAASMVADARAEAERAGATRVAEAEQIEITRAAAAWAARCAAAGARLREAISGYTAHRLQLTVRPGNCMCAVCRETVVEVVFLPCTHASLCRRCFANNAHHGNCMECAAAVTSVEDVIVT